MLSLIQSTKNPRCLGGRDDLQSGKVWSRTLTLRLAERRSFFQESLIQLGGLQQNTGRKSRGLLNLIMIYLNVSSGKSHGGVRGGACLILKLRGALFKSAVRSPLRAGLSTFADTDKNSARVSRGASASARLRKGLKRSIHAPPPRALSHAHKMQPESLLKL